MFLEIPVEFEKDSLDTIHGQLEEIGKEIIIPVKLKIDSDDGDMSGGVIIVKPQPNNNPTGLSELKQIVDNTSYIDDLMGIQPEVSQVIKANVQVRDGIKNLHDDLRDVIDAVKSSAGSSRQAPGLLATVGRLFNPLEFVNKAIDENLKGMSAQFRKSAETHFSPLTRGLADVINTSAAKGTAKTYVMTSRRLGFDSTKDLDKVIFDTIRDVNDPKKAGNFVKKTANSLAYSMGKGGDLQKEGVTSLIDLFPEDSKPLLRKLADPKSTKQELSNANKSFQRTKTVAHLRKVYGRNQDLTDPLRSFRVGQDIAEITKRDSTNTLIPFDAETIKEANSGKTPKKVMKAFFGDDDRRYPGSKNPDQGMKNLTSIKPIFDRLFDGFVVDRSENKETSNLKQLSAIYPDAKNHPSGANTFANSLVGSDSARLSAQQIFDYIKNQGKSASDVTLYGHSSGGAKVSQTLDILQALSKEYDADTEAGKYKGEELKERRRVAAELNKVKGASTGGGPYKRGQKNLMNVIHPTDVLVGGLENTGVSNVKVNAPLAASHFFEGYLLDPKVRGQLANQMGVEEKERSPIFDQLYNESVGRVEKFSKNKTATRDRIIAKSEKERKLNSTRLGKRRTFASLYNIITAHHEANFTPQGSGHSGEVVVNDLEILQNQLKGFQAKDPDFFNHENIKPAVDSAHEYLDSAREYYGKIAEYEKKGLIGKFNIEGYHKKNKSGLNQKLQKFAKFTRAAGEGLNKKGSPDFEDPAYEVDSTVDGTTAANFRNWSVGVANKFKSNPVGAAHDLYEAGKKVTDKTLDVMGEHDITPLGLIGRVAKTGNTIYQKKLAEAQENPNTPTARAILKLDEKKRQLEPKSVQQYQLTGDAQYHGANAGRINAAADGLLAGSDVGGKILNGGIEAASKLVEGGAKAANLIAASADTFNRKAISPVRSINNDSLVEGLEGTDINSLSKAELNRATNRSRGVKLTERVNKGVSEEDLREELSVLAPKQITALLSDTFRREQGEIIRKSQNSKRKDITKKIQAGDIQGAKEAHGVALREIEQSLTVLSPQRMAALKGELNKVKEQIPVPFKETMEGIGKGHDGTKFAVNDPSSKIFSEIARKHKDNTKKDHIPQAFLKELYETIGGKDYQDIDYDPTKEAAYGAAASYNPRNRKLLLSNRNKEGLARQNPESIGTLLHEVVHHAQDISPDYTYSKASHPDEKKAAFYKALGSTAHANHAVTFAEVSDEMDAYIKQNRYTGGKDWYKSAPKLNVPEKISQMYDAAAESPVRDSVAYNHKATRLLIPAAKEREDLIKNPNKGIRYSVDEPATFDDNQKARANFDFNSQPRSGESKLNGNAWYNTHKPRNTHSEYDPNYDPWNDNTVTTPHHGPIPKPTDNWGDVWDDHHASGNTGNSRSSYQAPRNSTQNHIQDFEKDVSQATIGITAGYNKFHPAITSFATAFAQRFQEFTDNADLAKNRFINVLKIAAPAIPKTYDKLVDLQNNGPGIASIEGIKVLASGVGGLAANALTAVIAIGALATSLALMKGAIDEADQKAALSNKLRAATEGSQDFSTISSQNAKTGLDSNYIAKLTVPVYNSTFGTDTRAAANSSIEDSAKLLQSKSLDTTERDTLSGAIQSIVAEGKVTRGNIAPLAAVSPDILQAIATSRGESGVGLNQSLDRGNVTIDDLNRALLISSNKSDPKTLASRGADFGDFVSQVQSGAGERGAKDLGAVGDAFSAIIKNLGGDAQGLGRILGSLTIGVAVATTGGILVLGASLLGLAVSVAKATLGVEVFNASISGFNSGLISGAKSIGAMAAAAVLAQGYLESIGHNQPLRDAKDALYTSLGISDSSKDSKGSVRKDTSIKSSDWLSNLTDYVSGRVGKDEPTVNTKSKADREDVGYRVKALLNFFRHIPETISGTEKDLYSNQKKEDESKIQGVMQGEQLPSTQIFGNSKYGSIGALAQAGEQGTLAKAALDAIPALKKAERTREIGLSTLNPQIVDATERLNRSKVAVAENPSVENQDNRDKAAEQLQKLQKQKSDLSTPVESAKAGLDTLIPELKKIALSSDVMKAALTPAINELQKASDGAGASLNKFNDELSKTQHIQIAAYNKGLDNIATIDTRSRRADAVDNASKQVADTLGTGSYGAQSVGVINRNIELGTLQRKGGEEIGRIRSANASIAATDPRLRGIIEAAAKRKLNTLGSDELQQTLSKLKEGGVETGDTSKLEKLVSVKESSSNSLVNINGQITQKSQELSNSVFERDRAIYEHVKQSNDAVVQNRFQFVKAQNALNQAANELDIQATITTMRSAMQVAKAQLESKFAGVTDSLVGGVVDSIIDWYASMSENLTAGLETRLLKTQLDASITNLTQQTAESSYSQQAQARDVKDRNTNFFGINGNAKNNFLNPSVNPANSSPITPVNQPATTGQPGKYQTSQVPAWESFMQIKDDKTYYQLLATIQSEAAHNTESQLGVAAAIGNRVQSGQFTDAHDAISRPSQFQAYSDHNIGKIKTEKDLHNWVLNMGYDPKETLKIESSLRSPEFLKVINKLKGSADYRANGYLESHGRAMPSDLILGKGGNRYMMPGSPDTSYSAATGNNILLRTQEMFARGVGNLTTRVPLYSGKGLNSQVSGGDAQQLEFKPLVADPTAKIQADIKSAEANAQAIQARVITVTSLSNAKLQRATVNAEKTTKLTEIDKDYNIQKGVIDQVRAGTNKNDEVRQADLTVRDRRLTEDNTRRKLAVEIEYNAKDRQILGGLGELIKSNANLPNAGEAKTLFDAGIKYTDTQGAKLKSEYANVGKDYNYRELEIATRRMVEGLNLATSQSKIDALKSVINPFEAPRQALARTQADTSQTFATQRADLDRKIQLNQQAINTTAKVLNNGVDPASYEEAYKSVRKAAEGGDQTAIGQINLDNQLQQQKQSYNPQREDLQKEYNRTKATKEQRSIELDAKSRFFTAVGSTMADPYATADYYNPLKKSIATAQNKTQLEESLKWLDDNKDALGTAEFERLRAALTKFSQISLKNQISELDTVRLSLKDTFGGAFHNLFSDIASGEQGIKGVLQNFAKNILSGITDHFAKIASDGVASMLSKAIPGGDLTNKLGLTQNGLKKDRDNLPGTVEDVNQPSLRATALKGKKLGDETLEAIPLDQQVRYSAAVGNFGDTTSNPINSFQSTAANGGIPVTTLDPSANSSSVFTPDNPVTSVSKGVDLWHDPEPVRKSTAVYKEPSESSKRALDKLAQMSAETEARLYGTPIPANLQNPNNTPETPSGLPSSTSINPYSKVESAPLVGPGILKIPALPEVRKETVLPPPPPSLLPSGGGAYSIVGDLPNLTPNAVSLPELPSIPTIEPEVLKTLAPKNTLDSKASILPSLNGPLPVFITNMPDGGLSLSKDAPKESDLGLPPKTIPDPNAIPGLPNPAAPLGLLGQLAPFSTPSPDPSAGLLGTISGFSTTKDKGLESILGGANPSDGSGVFGNLLGGASAAAGGDSAGGGIASLLGGAAKSGGGRSPWGMIAALGIGLGGSVAAKAKHLPPAQQAWQSENYSPKYIPKTEEVNFNKRNLPKNYRELSTVSGNTPSLAEQTQSRFSASNVSNAAVNQATYYNINTPNLRSFTTSEQQRSASNQKDSQTSFHRLG